MPNRDKHVAISHRGSFNRMFAALLTVAVAGLFFAVSAVPASAESRTCKRLERQLASLGSGGGSRSSSRIRKAIRGQQKQIGLAKRRMSRLGCSKRRLFFFRDAHPSCGQLRGALQRMRNNLAALRSQGGGGARSTKRQRNKIRRAMRQNQCGVTRKAKRNRNDSISDQIFGTKRSKRDRKAARNAKRKELRERKQKLAAKKAEDAARQLRKASTVRTMCVRTCDGYFFPVSLSSKSGKNGVAACERLCPGTEMQLYFHKSAGKEPKDMVSLASGRRYSALPTAFAYQKSFNPNCSCNFRKAVRPPKTVAGDAKRSNKQFRTAAQAVRKTAMPAWRPDSAADPETAANRRGGLKLAELGAPNEKRPFDQVSQRNVRVIGESFLPSQ